MTGCWVRLTGWGYPPGLHSWLLGLLPVLSWMTAEAGTTAELSEQFFLFLSFPEGIGVGKICQYGCFPRTMQNALPEQLRLEL